ncbi:acetyl-CoA C-acyltransferase [Rubrivivax gelatinosus]|uniref:Acetyl-CoA acetyltransferase n=1 Tax=Rubrivivax gelatinosus (strain NBRC 100245 / IL144) TaxID=983917 RepID=I0HXF1_RUBGI|nr:acetyl-CoA C-acyltransferase [Rubrivivax gelatinosus]BAL97688.1 acetyl-CoA acetyltransferase [Rubrivivax gelatinosus IL144]
MPESIVIASAARTPIGGLLGDFASLQAWELGAVAVKAAVERAGVPGDAVDEVLLGNCLMAGQGQAPARQALRRAGLPDSAGAVTLSKMCGSGMRTMMFAHDMLAAGSADVLVAGGMESMTNAPHLVFARKGVKYGAAPMYDHMALDGLEDAYERGKAMGVFAEQCVAKYGFSREAQDAFAIASTARSKQANEDGSFDWEIAPVTLAGKGGDTVVRRDEQPFKARPDKIPGLKPAFKKDGTITAASASSISDGAAALVLMRESTAARHGITPLARIVSQAVHAQAPDWFTTAPVGAIGKVLAKAGWKAADVDLWEVNEAFAAVTMAAMHEYELAHEIVNVHGGACALGHPIGASGARIVVTLLGALRQRGLRRGVAALCIGGGEATAMAVEVL